MKVENCTLIKPLLCKKQDNVVLVAKILRENRQRRIIVLDENDSPFGIISTTDINNRVVAENKDASRLTAEHVMTSPIFLVCDVNEDLEEVFKKMLHHESFFCPVTREGKLCGILTYGELIKHVHQKIKHGTS